MDLDVKTKTEPWSVLSAKSGSVFFPSNSGSATLPSRAGLAGKKRARDRVEVIKREKAPDETQIIRCPDISKMENALCRGF